MLGRWADFLQHLCDSVTPERHEKQVPNFKSKGRAFVFIGPLPNINYQPSRMPAILIADATTHELIEECTDDKLMALMGYVTSRYTQHRSYRQ